MALSPQRPWRGWRGWRDNGLPLLIAEIGGNHEGDFGYALRLADLAIDAGADVVKFQVYYADDFVNPRESADRHAHFRKFELDPEQHLALARHCRDRGASYLSSVWSLSALDWLDGYLDFYKVGSGDLTSHDILRQFAERGKPLVLSTGLSTLEEVCAAVDAVRAANPLYEDPQHLAVMQCTSMYPIEKTDANLLAMEAIRRATGAAPGYSDHTRDAQALRVATALGAEVLEFHFTDTREGKTFRDHFVSLTPEELGSLREDLAGVIALRGDGIKRPLPVETDSGHTTSFRRAVYVARDVSTGTVLTREDLCLMRPAHGLPADRLDEVVGLVAECDLPALSCIRITEDGRVAADHGASTAV